MPSTFADVLATMPHSKTFEIGGVPRTYHFTEDERISAAREKLFREEDAGRRANLGRSIDRSIRRAGATRHDAIAVLEAKLALLKAEGRS